MVNSLAVLLAVMPVGFSFISILLTPLVERKQSKPAIIKSNLVIKTSLLTGGFDTRFTLLNHRLLLWRRDIRQKI
jgi:hypothetical protein